MTDDFLAEQLARIATAVARKDYRDYEVKKFDVECVLEAIRLLKERLDGKDQTT